MLAQLLVTALAITLALAQQPGDVADAFISAELVPDVVPSFDPIGLLSVVYKDSTGQSIDVTPGVNLTTDQVALRPEFSLTSNDSSLSGNSFVLIMVDPDAPTPQNRSLSEIRHLVAPLSPANGADFASGVALTNTTPAISDYISPGPPPGSDPHRYTLLLFVQPDNFTNAAPGFVNASTAITGFNVTEFAQELGLGAPIAGNFFMTGPAATTSSASTSSMISTTSGAASTSTSTAGPVGGENGSLFRIILEFVFGDAIKEAKVDVNGQEKVVHWA